MLFVVNFCVNFGLYFIKAKKIMLKKILWVLNDTPYNDLLWQLKVIPIHSLIHF